LIVPQKTAAGHFMSKQKVLFVCIHNSARSQMAEALLNQYCGNQFEAHSAGLEPGILNPLAVAAMREIGIDISQKPTQSIFDVFKTGRLFAYVVTVCDEANAERCPMIPGVTQPLHWGFPDPSGFTGTWEERLQKTREVRYRIEERIKAWCASTCENAAWMT
jgi:arsenate reductase